MRALLLLPVFLFAFDPIAYVQEEHDKLFFGAGGSMALGISADYSDQFPDYSKILMVQAGIGDYPFVLDAKYAMEWASGIGEGRVSGTGAALTAYQILSSMRIYLFWKHPKVKSYISTGLAVHQEERVSTNSSSQDIFTTTDGVRMGLYTGLWLDLVPADAFFLDIGITYKYLLSDLFDYREMVGLECLVNIGQ